MKAGGPMKPEIFTIWPFTETVFQLCLINQKFSEDKKENEL